MSFNIQKKIISYTIGNFLKLMGKIFMKIISWNVNGIRSVHKKGFPEWFAKESPDILCLQETKAHLEQFTDEIRQFSDYKLYASCAMKKGYSGVATLSKEKILDTQKMNIKSYDDEGRVLIHELDHFYLINCYFPNGQRDHKRVPFKMKFCRDILKKLNHLREKKPLIITGDFNTAHAEIDLANPKSNKNTTGFLDIERKWVDEFISEGYIDIFRHLHPELKGAYTWWSNRPGVRARNIGWRIDYFFITHDLLSRVKDTKILNKVTGSDHCPIVLEIKDS
jgi:exodeoxyribonuclease III